MSPEIATIIAVTLVSGVSLVGAGILAVSRGALTALMPLLVALAAGALLSDAFIHLIPEAVEILASELAFGVAALAGLASFYILEHSLSWHHAHHAHEDHETPHHLGPLVLAADSVHNILDGALIAGSFLISPAVGVATTIAVLLHEIPQEIADFALLVHSGFTRAQALIFNFLSGLTALFGAAFVFILGSLDEKIGAYTAAFTAGAFIYISAADLLPQLHTSKSRGTIALQVIGVILGAGTMVLLAFYE